MAWNEPGGGKRDPWSGGDGGGGQGPPDLEEVVRKMQDKLGGLFGGKRRSGGGGGGGGGFAPRMGAFGAGVLVIVALALWALTGFYIVDEGKRGVVLRFGAYQATTLAGLNWHIPFPVESVEVVDVEQQRYVEIGYRSGPRTPTRTGTQGAVPLEGLMLTEDENIVDVQLAIQYRVKNARDYLFNVRDPDVTLKQASESAVRENVGQSRMDFVITQGRSEIVQRTQAVLQDILDQYETGLQVMSVNMQQAAPPQQVREAFDDAVKAREDEQRLKNEAEAYASEIIPVARGAAARNLENGNAYKARVVAEAEGDASRFTQLREAYERAPEIMRERLYLETMETVLAESPKVLLDAEDSNNLIYLPLDRLMKQAAAGLATDTLSRLANTTSSAEEPSGRRTRDEGRGRRAR